MKNIRNLAFLILVVAATVGVNAQTTLSGKVQFPSDVRWGKSVLPAGEYSLSIPSAERPVRVFIHSMDGKTAAIALTEILSDPQPGGSYIVTTGTGSDRRVCSMNLPQMGFSLVYVPLTARERETLYASAAHTLPVQTAGK
jgi:hypothetical protein